MEKYLQYLLNDLEALIGQAPMPASENWCLEEEDDMIPSKWIKIADLIDLPAEAFPPARFLTDLQLIELVEYIGDLWSAWDLHWEMPAGLSAPKQYAAFVREMEGASIFYHPAHGADVHICQYEEGKACPFQPENGHCQCREAEESTKHDIELWEEYIDSQGLDPYREMTKEEESLFEEDMRQRELKKHRPEDRGANIYDWHNMFNSDLSEEEMEEFLHAIKVQDELLDAILGDFFDPETDLPTDDEDDDF